MMNREVFYAYARRAPFGGRISKEQVTGTNALLDAWDRHGDGDDRKLANVLAQVFHETGGRMVPVRETFASSDGQAIRRLDAAWRQGRLPQVSKPYWRDGWFGRGPIQVTHEDNYIRMAEALGVDLHGKPGLLLDLEVGALVVTPAATFAQYTHFHLAVTRDVGGVMRIFHNGALVGGGDPALHTATVQMTSDTAWYFGANPDYFGFGTGGRCVLDDIVLTLGSARYSPTGFTPPAAESVPGVPGSSGAYEITTSYTGEAYAVGIAPADPVRNHSIIRVVPG